MDINQTVFIPKQIKHLLNILKTNKFKAFLVGGCVRDSLLKHKTFDYDIITNAKPFDLKRLFNQYNLDLKGEKYGVVGVYIEKIECQVATFRREFDYTDHVHPENLDFNVDLKDDLYRRDFTINALAYDLQLGTIDLFSGLDDLKNKKLISIDCAYKKFKQDPSRILRGLRFVSILGFEFGENEKQASLELKDLIKHVSSDKIRCELSKMILGDYFYLVVKDYFGILNIFLFNNNFNVNSSLINNIAISVKNSPKDETIRMVLLFYNFIKTDSYNNKLYTIKNSLTRLNYSKKAINNILSLIDMAQHPLPIDEKDIFKFSIDYGFDSLKQIYSIKKSLSYINKTYENISGIKDTINKINSKNYIYNLKDLKINGDNLKEMGCPEGENIKTILNKLLVDVNFNSLINNKKSLYNMAKKYIKE